jgi:hypothetical protein
MRGRNCSADKVSHYKYGSIFIEIKKLSRKLWVSECCGVGIMGE